jgi:hypothetical protein
MNVKVHMFRLLMMCLLWQVNSRHVSTLDDEMMTWNRHLVHEEECRPKCIQRLRSPQHHSLLRCLILKQCAIVLMTTRSKSHKRKKNAVACYWVLLLGADGPFGSKQLELRPVDKDICSCRRCVVYFAHYLPVVHLEASMSLPSRAMEVDLKLTGHHRLLMPSKPKWFKPTLPCMIHRFLASMDPPSRDQ